MSMESQDIPTDHSCRRRPKREDPKACETYRDYNSILTAQRVPAVITRLHVDLHDFWQGFNALNLNHTFFWTGLLSLLVRFKFHKTGADCGTSKMLLTTCIS